MAIRKRPDGAPEERLEASRQSLVQLANACGEEAGVAQPLARVLRGGITAHPPDPEPTHVAGHEAAGNVAEALAGKHRSDEQNQHSDRGRACSHALYYLGSLRAIQTPPYTIDFCAVYWYKASTPCSLPKPDCLV